MNQETQGLSKQQIKSRETRAKDFPATQPHPQKQGYCTIVNQNISAEAHASPTGFFLHIITRKMLLIILYRRKVKVHLDPPNRPLVPLTQKALISVYLNYVHYCEELGVEFMANYYTPKNQSLNPLIRTERPYPIVTVHDYLKRVIESGIISPSADLEDITTDIRMIVIGNVFEWCLKSGDADFEGNMRRSLTTYLNGLF